MKLALQIQGSPADLRHPQLTAWGYDNLVVQSSARSLHASLAGKLAAFASAAVVVPERGQSAANDAEFARCLSIAASWQCPAVLLAMSDDAVQQTSTRAFHVAVQQLNNWAALATRAGVQLWLQNAGCFSRARDMWTLLQTIESPGLKVCWDTVHAASLGESAALSLPMLNHQLAAVQLGTAETVMQNPQLKSRLQRLQGLGFAGHLMVHAQADQFTSDAQPGVVAQAAQRVRETLALATQVTEKPKAKPVKAAAK